MKRDHAVLRDNIAMHALSALPPLMLKNEPDLAAEIVYRLADAMLARRGKPTT